MQERSRRTFQLVGKLTGSKKKRAVFCRSLWCLQREGLPEPQKHVEEQPLGSFHGFGPSFLPTFGSRHTYDP